MKTIQEELKQISEMLQLDKQHDWFNTYKVDAIQLGRLCEKFPALQKSWNEFKIVYDICRSQDGVDR